MKSLVVQAEKETNLYIFSLHLYFYLVANPPTKIQNKKLDELINLPIEPFPLIPACEASSIKSKE